MSGRHSPPTVRVHGVDFSGAAEPGDDCWVGSAELDDGGRPAVTSLRSASEAFGEGREAVLAGLREFVATADGPVGVDCPFGLPRQLHECGSYREFLTWFGDAFDGPGDLESACVDRATALTGGERAYLKRAADERTGAQSPYFWFTRAATYYGVAELVAPLVAEGAGVEPMAPAPFGGPTLLEVYPAATLRDLELPDEGYKAASDEARALRESILDGLADRGLSCDDAVRRKALDDAGGDALDALVATVATARAAEGDFRVVDDASYHPVEGYIYV